MYFVRQITLISISISFGKEKYLSMRWIPSGCCRRRSGRASPQAQDSHMMSTRWASCPLAVALCENVRPPQSPCWTTLWYWTDSHSATHTAPMTRMAGGTQYKQNYMRIRAKLYTQNYMWIRAKLLCEAMRTRRLDRLKRNPLTSLFIEKYRISKKYIKTWIWWRQMASSCYAFINNVKIII